MHKQKNTFGGAQAQISVQQHDSTGAIILAGGKGTRMAHLTRDEIPKPLLKVAGRELITYSLDVIRNSSVDKVVIAAKHLADQIEFWVASADIPAELVYMGIKGNSSAAAISEAMSIIGRNLVVICSGDEIIRNLDLNMMLEQHERSKSLITLLAADPRNAVGEGVLLEIDGMKVTGITERRHVQEVRQADFLMHAGLIVMDREAIRLLDLSDRALRSGAIDMPIMRGGMAAGIIDAYIDRNVVFFNVNTPEEATLAEAYLYSAKRR